MTVQEELDLVNNLLQQAGSNGGVQAWQEGTHRVQNYSLKELLAWKQDVENRLTQETSPLTMPVREVYQ